MDVQPLILIAPDRVLHICRLGSRLDTRVIGAMVVYFGLSEELTVDLGERGMRRARIVAVEPFLRHRVAAGSQLVCTILVEPETVSAGCLADLLGSLNDPTFREAALSDIIASMLDFQIMTRERMFSYSNHHFDQAIFGYALEQRVLDRRVDRGSVFMSRNLGEGVLMTECAREAAISGSRFRRLFTESTGMHFRHYRMWKRVRAWLSHIEEDSSLTEIALDLGYPDSAHFSRSIRSAYGLPPRRMKASMMGSRFVIPGRLG